MQIEKYTNILLKLGIGGKRSEGSGAVETVPTEWEDRYKQELYKKEDLERDIHQLDKLNK